VLFYEEIFPKSRRRCFYWYRSVLRYVTIQEKLL